MGGNGSRFLDAPGAGKKKKKSNLKLGHFTQQVALLWQQGFFFKIFVCLFV